MQPKKPRRYGDGPEARIQGAIVDKLRMYGWHVMETHGNMYQQGFPDIFACHQMFGARWIEVKNPAKYSFTPAQVLNIPKMCMNGAPVWILMSASDEEYKKLFKPYNAIQIMYPPGG